MLNRTYGTITLANGKRKLTVTFAEEKYELLSAFLFIEVSSFEEWIKDEFRLVLNGQENCRNIAGNACELCITKETTKIYDMLAEDGKGKWCEKNTSFKVANTV